MTVSFENVRKGDRVRLTVANGDLAEITVLSVAHSAIYDRANRVIRGKDWDTLEILPKPLPTEPGFWLSGGSVWEIDDDGDVFALVRHRLALDARHAPFIRLVPESEVGGTPGAIDDLTDAIRLTVEYVGNDTLPAIEGWSWYDALMKYRPKLAQEFKRRPVHTARQTGAGQ